MSNSLSNALGALYDPYAQAAAQQQSQQEYLRQMTLAAASSLPSPIEQPDDPVLLLLPKRAA